MLRSMCKSKIHRARVTASNLNYVGSITVDETLMQAANLLEYEEVHVLNINNGARIVTYVLKGEVGSGVICVNGAASRYFQKNDLIIIANFACYSEIELVEFKPKHIYVNQNNEIIGDCLELRKGEIELLSCNH